MTTEWPHKSPYSEAAARLRDAITIAVIRDAVDEFTAQMGAVSRADVSNTHATNIRDEIATGADMSRFGPYAAAIARWEQTTGRPAPPPTTPSRRPGGKPQLSARFVE